MVNISKMCNKNIITQNDNSFSSPKNEDISKSLEDKKKIKAIGYYFLVYL